MRGGLLIRQMHHWAADIFIGSIIVHMARIFFTGAFRKPRELNWLIGITMLILAILDGFIGYSLPDDLISGTGLRIGYSIAESIPFVGSYLVTFLWGGQFPGTGIIIPRFFIIHVLIIPLVMLGLLAAHLGLLVRQKHTQFPGEGRTEHNVVGSPMFPTFMAKTTGFLFMVTGGHGPARGLRPDQPDLAVRLLRRRRRSPTPSSRTGTWAGSTAPCASCRPGSSPAVGHTIPFEVFLPAVVFPGLIFTICHAVARASNAG